MKRTTVAAALIAAVIASTGVLPASAQIAPGDAGSGQERGMQQLDNSGQVGTVTLHNLGSKTSVVVALKSADGRTEPAHLHRGKACDATVDPKPAYPLKDVVNGRSSTVLNAPMDKLLSGNYVVIVHSSMQNMNRYVSCGLLYR